LYQNTLNQSNAEHAYCAYASAAIKTLIVIDT
jgi:hypothetical protein